MFASCSALQMLATHIDMHRYTYFVAFEYIGFESSAKIDVVDGVTCLNMLLQFVGFLC